MSTLLAGAVTVAAAAVTATAGFLLVSKYVPERWLVADAGAAGTLYATIGMAYAILIAIAAVAVWEPHDDATQAVRQEAGDLSEAYWSAGALDTADATRIRGLIVVYDRFVVDQEWPRMRARHTADAVTSAAFDQLRAAAAALRPASDAQADAASDIQDRLEDAADARRARVTAAGTGMPPLLWPALILGGVVSIVFLYLFGMERTIPNSVMMATVAGMTALMLFVIYQVEFPFSHGLSIGPAPFRAALATMTGPT